MTKQILLPGARQRIILITLALLLDLANSMVLITVIV
jgi:hypothetical protein